MNKSDGEEKRSDIRVILLSLFINLCVYLPSLLISPHYETNDDSILSGLLYGTYGHMGTSFLPFLSRLWGKCLYGLASLFPGINVYFITHIIICFTASTVVTVVLMDRFRGKKVVPVLIVWFASVFEVYHFVQFTKTAGLATIAGILGVLYFVDKRKYPVLTGVSGLLIFLGYSLRSSSFFLGFLSMGVVFVYFLIDRVFKSPKLLLRYIIVFGISFLFVGLSMAADYSLAKTDEGVSYYENYNTQRSWITENCYNNSEITDSLKTALRELGERDGIMYSDYRMAAAWMSNDSEMIDCHDLQEINQYLQMYNRCSYSHMISVYIHNVLPYMITAESMFGLILTLFVISMLFSGNRLYVLGIPVVFSVIQCYLIIHGRYLFHRVDYVVFLACILSLIFLFDYPSKPEKYKIPVYLAGIIAGEAILFFCATTLSMSITTTISDKEDVISNYSAVEEIIRSDELYMVHPYVPVYEDPNANIYLAPQKDIFRGDFMMGGWTTAGPFDGVIDCDIEGNPWVECIDSNNIRLILPTGGSDYMLEVITSHIETHYGIHAVGVLQRSNDYCSVYSLVTEETE